MKKCVLSMILIALVATVVLAVFGELRSYPPPKVVLPISQYLPDAAEAAQYGWQVQDLPLGATEGIEERALEILKFDDYIYRRYSKGSLEFSVYVAYWRPGKMPPREVNGHNPDNCWVNSGWIELESRDAVTYPGLNFASPRGQFRIYSRDGRERAVYFWHLLDGETYQYGHRSIFARLRILIREPIRQRFMLKREQIFIRIDTSDPSIFDSTFTSYTAGRLFKGVL